MNTSAESSAGLRAALLEKENRYMGEKANRSIGLPVSGEY